jgi:hypothetical protein
MKKDNQRIRINNYCILSLCLVGSEQRDVTPRRDVHTAKARYQIKKGRVCMQESVHERYTIEKE